MSDRTGYKSRVSTVRGRARAQLAAIRKDRLARKRVTAARDAFVAELAAGRMASAEARDPAADDRVPFEEVVTDADAPDIDVPAEDAPLHGTEPPPTITVDVLADPNSPEGGRAEESAILSEDAAEPSGTANEEQRHDCDAAVPTPCNKGPDASDEVGCVSPGSDDAEVPHGGGTVAEHAEGPLIEASEDDALPVAPTVDGSAWAATDTDAHRSAAVAQPGRDAAGNLNPSADPDTPSTAEDAARQATARCDTTGPKSHDATGTEKSDLHQIPGIGSGLVWMLQSAGVQTLAELAHAEPRDLADRLGTIARLLDLDHFISQAETIVRRQMIWDTRG